MSDVKPPPLTKAEGSVADDEMPSSEQEVNAQTDDEMDDDEWEEKSIGSRFSIFTALPAWLVSLVFHMLVLVLLALFSFSTAKEELKGVFVTSSATRQEDSILEELTEVEFEPMEELEQTEQWSLAAEVADPGAIAFGDLGSLNDIETDADVGTISLPSTTIDDIGALFGADGEGMSDIGEGLAAASFFGTKSKGRDFVFVVDNSNSMTKGRFETALNELMMTIEAMSPQQKFYIIFFSDTAYRMFHPKPAPGLVAATESNKERVRAWLYTVQMCLQTRGEEAVKTAISLNPDVIYILGDGAFTDKTLQILTAPHNRSIPINTIGMEVDPSGAKQLQAIAAANNGKYRLVAALPAAKLMAKNNPVKRNNVRGPVWGVKLPLVAKKRKKN